MTNRVEVELSTVDGLTNAFSKATSATNDLNKALAKLVIQEQNNRIMEEAKAKFASMSESEKQAAVSAAALVEQQEKLKTQKDTPNKLAMAWTEFNSALSVAKQAIQAVKKVYDETIGATLAYDLEIRKLAQNLGISTEETSRAIQTADDFGISQGEVTSALEMMVKRGTAPSIEALAEIADRYNAIKDPIQQAALMTELLGRNWTALTPMLREGGDVIRDTAASQAQGMLVTEAQAQAAEDLRVSIDRLNDTWTAIRNNLANKVIPTMGDLVDSFSFGIANLQALTEGYIGLLEMHRLDQLATINTTAAMEGLNEAIAKSPKHLKELADALAKETFEASQYRRATVEATEVTQEQTKAVSDISLEQKQLSLTTGALTYQTYEQVRAREDLKLVTEALDIANRNLSTAEDKLASAQQNLNNSMGAEAVSAAEGARQSFGRTLEAIKIQDQVFGTHAADSKTRSKEIEDATRAFMNSPQTEADKNAYKARLDEIKTKYLELDESIEASKTKVGELQAVVDALHGKDISINVLINQLTGGTPAAPGHPDVPSYPNPTPGHKEGDPAGGENYWHWNGTAWVVVHGYGQGGSFRAGESILVGDRGPEVLTPSTAGNITNNNYWNLAIHSNARHEQVAADFELMRSLHSPGV